MKLQDALLCVECESLYTFSSRCPHCGSQVSFPLGRAINRSSVCGGRRDGSSLSFGRSGAMSVGNPLGGALTLQQSA